MKRNPLSLAAKLGIAAGAGLVVYLLFGSEAEAMPVSPNDAERIKKILASAAKYGIPPAVALAVADVESGGSSGFAKNGRMIIRFEPYTFKDRSGKDPPPVKRGGQDREWGMLEAAMQIDREAALKSISMGMFQIMGFNYKTVGYPSVQAMFDAYSNSQDAQVQGFFDFVSSVSGDEYQDGPSIKLDEAARKGNFLAFARGYNGRGQKGYDKKIKARYDHWVSRGYQGV